MGLFRKKSEAPVEVVDKNLYILLEQEKPGIVTYLESSGMHVKGISTNLNKLMLMLIREKNPIRLLIVDFNNGDWNRKDIADNLVGLVASYSNEPHDCTIFTRNSYLRLQLNKRQINADVREFKGASDIVKALLEYNENYVSSGASDFIHENKESLLEYTFNKNEDPKEKEKRLSFGKRKIIDITDINVEASGESLTGYNCKF